MCTFITLTLNADADPAAVKMTMERLGFRFEEIPPAKGLPAGRRYLAHDSGHCDCGTAVGQGAPPRSPSGTSGMAAELRKKGWSAARIKQWETQRRTRWDGNERTRKERQRRQQRELAGWTGLIRGLLDTPSVEVCGLLHDCYATMPVQEELPIAIEPSRPAKRLDENALLRLPEGTLVEWTLQGVFTSLSPGFGGPFARLGRARRRGSNKGKDLRSTVRS